MIVWPEVTLLSMVGLILMADVCLKPRYRLATYYLVQLTLVAAFVVTLPQFREYSSPILLFSHHYVVYKLAVLSKLFIYLFSFFAFAYARDYITTRKIPRSEFYLLALMSVLGMSVMASAYTFLTIFLGLELLSLPLYAIVAMYKQSSEATEAAMKYFVLGALASGFFLYGVSILYGISGSIEMGAVAHAVSLRHDMVPLMALVFVLSGLLFKFGAVPFHMWVPDVYQGAAKPVTLYIASAQKWRLLRLPCVFKWRLCLTCR